MAMNFMCTNLKQGWHKRPKAIARPDTRGPGVLEIHPKNQFENFSVHLSGGRVFLSPVPVLYCERVVLLCYHYIATLYLLQYKTGTGQRA